jgi:putative acetyltransferase
MKVLETERLILRPFKERDLNDLYDYAKNDKVGPMAGWNPHKNIEESAIILKHFMKDKNILAIFHKADKKVIGSIGIRKDLKRDYNYCASLGFALGENYWGQGLICEASKEIMKYVFEDLKLNILSVEHFPSNLQSKRV